MNPLSCSLSSFFFGMTSLIFVIFPSYSRSELVLYFSSSVNIKRCAPLQPVKTEGIFFQVNLRQRLSTCARMSNLSRRRQWLITFTSQSSDHKSFFFFRVKISAKMGSCNSVICSDGTSEKVGEMAKKKESEEIEETPVIEIHINCPVSKVDSRQSQVELKQDSGTGHTRPSSVEALDVESSEQSLSDASLVLSEDDRAVGHSQDLEEDFSLKVQGKSCLPRNVTVTGLAQQNDFQGCALASVESPACSSWNENQLQRQGNGSGECSNWAKEGPGSSGLHGAPKISLPLPRPSLWQQVYCKTLKKRERLVEEKLQRKMQGRPRKEAVSLEEAIRARSIRVIKKVKKSMRLEADQDPNSGPAVLPPDEAIARMFGVTVEDCRDSSSDNSSSQASSRLTSAASCHSSVTSARDLEAESLENANNGQKGGWKSRKWFRLARNKVAPL